MQERAFGPVVIEAIANALQVAGHFCTEKDLQGGLYTELSSRGACERECRAEFEPAIVSPPSPPQGFKAIDVCEKRGCRKVDLVSMLDSHLVAIELKFSRSIRWKGSFRGVPLPNPTGSDVVTYGFLKDIHRMERLNHVTFGGQRVVPQYRVCALVSNERFDTEGRTPHERMRLCPRTLPAGHLVSYNDCKPNGKPTSPITLWKDYPPFCLAHPYVIGWLPVNTDLNDFVPADNEREPYRPFQVVAVDVSFAGNLKNRSTL